MAFTGDTSDEVEQMRLAAIRARSPEDRLRDALEISEIVHAAVIARMRQQYPDKSGVELALMLGEEEAEIHRRRDTALREAHPRTSTDAGAP